MFVAFDCREPLRAPSRGAMVSVPDVPLKTAPPRPLLPTPPLPPGPPEPVKPSPPVAQSLRHRHCQPHRHPHPPAAADSLVRREIDRDPGEGGGAEVGQTASDAAAGRAAVGPDTADPDPAESAGASIAATAAEAAGSKARLASVAAVRRRWPDCR